MPKSQERKRGGVIRYRTIRLNKKEYAYLAIVRKPGKRGGHTIIGKIMKYKRYR